MEKHTESELGVGGSKDEVSVNVNVNVNVSGGDEESEQFSPPSVPLSLKGLGISNKLFYKDFSKHLVPEPIKRMNSLNGVSVLPTFSKTQMEDIL